MAEDGYVPPKLRSDEERLAALRRGQEAMRTPEGFDIDAVVRKACGGSWVTRSLTISIFFDLVRMTHYEDSWRDRRRLKKKTKTLRDTRKHVRQCSRCKEHLGEFMEFLQRDIDEWKNP